MDLPGYQILRELGRGGMARVYLAVQKRLGRTVALKVVGDELAQDAEFRKRFLQESRINAQLSHPNIVQVYDVGAHDDALFLVMEYVGGGDLTRRLERGMRVENLIRVVKDIGRALDYAHGRGFVHRDIKPENILFREDGSAVLSDFGIARVIDATPSISRTGTVLGTPQYMSPEQAAGRALDGRSDLYSLGVVFYRVLTGDVPYKADTAVSIGIKHLQEPIPRLPNYLAAFQPVLDSALAKRPEARFQTGAEFAAALDAVRARPGMTNPTIRSQAVTTQEIRAVGSAMFAVREPVRGQRTTRRQRQLQMARPVVSVILLATLIGGASVLFVAQPDWVTRLAASLNLIEDPTIQDAWRSARSLREDPNQSLATIVAGYRRVLTLDPSHRRAEAALATIATQWKSDIDNALTQGNLTQAETRLAESLSAFPDDASLRALADKLTNRKHAESLLLSTQGLLRSHGPSDMPSATAAIQALQEVLRLAPAHPTARIELDNLSRYYAGLAAAAADAGEVDDAIAFLDRASAASDRLPELAQAREKIQQATTLQEAIGEMLQQASAYRAAGALINPPGANAAELYHRVLATDPENTIAAQGVNEVVSQLLIAASNLLQSGELDRTRALIERATAVGLDPQAVNRLRARLDAEVSRIATVARNLADAEALLADGFITEPQPRNAVALLRDVERLDPGNEQAQALLGRAAQRLASVAREAYGAGLEVEAKHYLELALAITPDATEWRELRRQWEQRDANP
ncbi:MAG: protein kinase domain-containing protein [Pseudomonadales bacterium]